MFKPTFIYFALMFSLRYALQEVILSYKNDTWLDTTFFQGLWLHVSYWAPTYFFVQHNTYCRGIFFAQAGALAALFILWPTDVFLPELDYSIVISACFQVVYALYHALHYFTMLYGAYFLYQFLKTSEFVRELLGDD